MARMFVLGAGFSRPAGLPLTNDLLALVLQELEEIHGQPTHLHRALDRYRSFLTATTGEVPDPLNVELFAEFLDYQHFLGLRGSDTWSEEGNRDQLLLRWGIGRVIHRMTPPEIPALYLDFAERLTPDDAIVSFNYDTLVEKALESVGKLYRRFPSRFSEVSMMGATTDSEAEQDEILVSKLHGSIDWVSRRSFERTQALFRGWGDHDTADYIRDHDSLFGPNPVTPTKPLVEGPRPDDDPLAGLEQITDLDAYYGNHNVAYSHPPLVLPPSRAKQLYGSPLRPLWEGMGLLGWVWGGVNIVGYSLPPDDTYTRQVLWELVSGYRRALSDPGWRIQDVNRIVVVDLRDDHLGRSDLLNAYRFLPNEFTDFITTGFDVTSLDAMFPLVPFARRRRDDAPEPEPDDN